MHHKKSRRFRYHSNDRGYKPRDKIGEQIRQRSNSFRNGRGRNNINIHQSAEKLVEKYSTLAKEALSTGDRILSENYYQHADHFLRIVENKKINQDQNRTQPTEKSNTSDSHSTNNTKISQAQDSQEKKE